MQINKINVQRAMSANNRQKVQSQNLYSTNNIQQDKFELSKPMQKSQVAFGSAESLIEEFTKKGYDKLHYRIDFIITRLRAEKIDKLDKLFKSEELKNFINNTFSSEYTKKSTSDDAIRATKYLTTTDDLWGYNYEIYTNKLILNPEVKLFLIDKILKTNLIENRKELIGLKRSISESYNDFQTDRYLGLTRQYKENGGSDFVPFEQYKDYLHKAEALILSHVPHPSGTKVLNTIKKCTTGELTDDKYFKLLDLINMQDSEIINLKLSAKGDRIIHNLAHSANRVSSSIEKQKYYELFENAFNNGAHPYIKDYDGVNIEQILSSGKNNQRLISLIRKHSQNLGLSEEVNTLKKSLDKLKKEYAKLLDNANLEAGEREKLIKRMNSLTDYDCGSSGFSGSQDDTWFRNTFNIGNWSPRRRLGPGSYPKLLEF